MLSALMEVKAKSLGSPERFGLILIKALTEAVAFEWDLEGPEQVEKGCGEILQSQESQRKEEARLSMFAFLKAWWLQA